MTVTAPGSCPNECAEHPEHVYVICYGRPVYVSDRDHIAGEVQGYRIDHYVGYTRQHPPIRRVCSHADRSGRRRGDCHLVLSADRFVSRRSAS